MADNSLTEIGNVHASMQGGYEEICEDLQLILAHAMESFGPDFYGEIGSATSPYLNPGLQPPHLSGDSMANL